MSKKLNPSTARNPNGKWILLMFVALLIAFGGLYFFNRDSTTPQGTVAPVESAPPSAIPREPELAAAGEETLDAQKALETLVGRWLREDGGYVIEIEDVLPDGTLKAAYYNPRPIHVSRAGAVQESGSVVVGIELNDVNYPGCLYRLILNRELDQLQGQYFQAGSGQTFEVIFIRMAEE
jgi:hypothetical protein